MSLTCECGRKRASSASIRARYKVSRVPVGPGPMDVMEVRQNRHKIVRDMVRNRRLQMVTGQRALSKMLHSFFTQKLQAICNRVEQLAGQRHPKMARKDTSDDAAEDEGVHFGAYESLWQSAIEEELGLKSSMDLIADYVPIVQSTAAQSYASTTIALGDEQSAAASHQILVRAQKMAKLVTRINETTRTQLINAIEDSMDNGDTLVETVRAIRLSIPEIASSRIPTIARTEIGRAIDEGVKLALSDSPSVTHVQVVGCTAIEPNIPTIDGIPTCNVAGVPADRLDELFFHVNHTGSIVAQYYVTDDWNGEIYSSGV